MIVNSDWHRHGTVASLSEQFGSLFHFSGPGLYLKDDQFLLIVPEGECENPWKQKWPEDTIFWVYYYGVPFLGAAGSSPGQG